MTFKYYKTGPLIIVIIILGWLIDFSVEKWLIPFFSNHLLIGTHLRIPTTEAIIALILVLYDRYLWKIPVLNLLMNIPNMAGRYAGKVKYEWNGVKGEKKRFIEIKQTASKIKIHSYFNNDADENTSSKSLVEDIVKEEDGFYDIYLFYLNSGSKQNGGLDCHEGANKLRFLPGRDGSSNKLTGHYFTNRQIQTRGEIEGILVSKNLHGKF